MVDSVDDGRTENEQAKHGEGGPTPRPARGAVSRRAEGNSAKGQAARKSGRRRKGRRYIPVQTKLASALILAFGIPHDIAKAMSRRQVLALVEWHHDVVPHAEGGAVVHWNITPVLWPEHAEITVRETRPQIEKGKRIRLNEEKHREFMRKLKPRKRAKRSKYQWGRREFVRR